MNKAERIKAEVERRLSDCGYAMGSENSPIIAKILYESYRSLLLFINSLEEEPVSNDLEEACDEYYDKTWDEHGGKAVVVDGCHDIWFPSQATDDFFKAGAQWQQQKTDRDMTEALRTEYEKGRHDVIEKTLKWLWDLNQQHEIMSYTDSHVLDSEELQKYYKNNIE